MSDAPNMTTLPLDFRALSASIIGSRADEVHSKWSSADHKFLVDVSEKAFKVELFTEALALDFWLLSRRPSVATCHRAFQASCALADFDTAPFLFDQLDANNMIKEADLLRYINIMPNDQLVIQGLGLLRRVQGNSLLRQTLWLKISLLNGAPEAKYLIPGTLKHSLKRRVLRFRSLLSAISYSGVFEKDPSLMSAVLDKCHKDNLLPLLSLIAEDGQIAAVDRSIAKRISERSGFWNDFIGNPIPVQTVLSLIRLNDIFSEAGIGGVCIESAENPMEGIKSTAAMAVQDFGAASIIICAYNSLKTLEYSIRSVALQSYTNLDIIVIDDCSTAPIEIDPAWSGERKVTLFRNPENLGPYLSRNVGISLAEGEYIGFHDADDWMHPDKIAHQISQMQKSKTSAHYGSHIRIGSDGHFRPENNGEFIGDGPITGLFRRDVFGRCGLFANIRTRGDIEFRRRLEFVLGASAVETNRLPYVLALNWDSNSKTMTDTLPKERAMSRFLSRSSKSLMLAGFVRDPKETHRIVDMGWMPVKGKLTPTDPGKSDLLSESSVSREYSQSAFSQ